MFGVAAVEGGEGDSVRVLNMNLGHGVDVELGLCYGSQAQLAAHGVERAPFTIADKDGTRASSDENATSEKIFQKVQQQDCGRRGRAIDDSVSGAALRPIYGLLVKDVNIRGTYQFLHLSIWICSV